MSQAYSELRKTWGPASADVDGQLLLWSKAMFIVIIIILTFIIYLKVRVGGMAGEEQ